MLLQEACQGRVLSFYLFSESDWNITERRYSETDIEGNTFGVVDSFWDRAGVACLVWQSCSNVFLAGVSLPLYRKRGRAAEGLKLCGCSSGNARMVLPVYLHSPDIPTASSVRVSSNDVSAGRLLLQLCPTRWAALVLGLQRAEFTSPLSHEVHWVDHSLPFGLTYLTRLMWE